MSIASTRRPRTAKHLAAKAAVAEPKPKRSIRTPEQLIADLEAKITQVKRRAEAKKVRKDPALRFVSGALRSIDKALAASEDQAARGALNEARTGLVAILSLSGVVVPAGRGRSGPRGAGPVIAEDALFAYIQAHPGSRSEYIAAGLGTDTAGVRPALVALKKVGMVVVAGKARSTRYSASTSTDSPRIGKD